MASEETSLYPEIVTVPDLKENIASDSIDSDLVTAANLPLLSSSSSSSSPTLLGGGTAPSSSSSASASTVFIDRGVFKILKQCFGTTRSRRVRTLIYPYMHAMERLYSGSASASNPRKGKRYLWNQINRQALKIIVSNTTPSKSEWIERAIEHVKECDQQLEKIDSASVPVLLHLNTFLVFVLREEDCSQSVTLREYLDQYTDEQLLYLVYLLNISRIYCLQLLEQIQGGNVVDAESEKALEVRVRRFFRTHPGDLEEIAENSVAFGANPFLSEACKESVRDALLNAPPSAIHKADKKLKATIQWIRETKIEKVLEVRVRAPRQK